MGGIPEVKKGFQKIDRNIFYSIIAIAIAVAVNVVFSFLTGLMDIPIYLDTAGTIVISLTGGFFPGILTAMLTNIVSMIHNTYSVYFAIISVLIAIFAAQIKARMKLKNVKTILILIAGATLISGIGSSFIQWVLFSAPQNAAIAEEVRSFHLVTGIPEVVVFFLINTAANLVDKGISVGVALVVVHYLPEEIKKSIKNSGWRQKPLSQEEIRSIRKWGSDVEHSVRTRMTLILLVIAAGVAAVISFIGVNLYFQNMKNEKTIVAVNAAKFAASVIDGDKVGEYLREGFNAEGYEETRQLLNDIRDTAVSVEFLYAMQIRDDAAYYVFDLDTEEEEAYLPGEREEFEESLKPLLPAMRAGEEIEPSISDDVFGWLLTAYYPVRNSQGMAVCYVGVDVSMSYLTDYLKSFVLKILLILAGFFILILAYGMWNTGIYTVYPINSIAECVDRFVTADDSQENIDENVRKLRSLNIHTGDEVERLYRSICRMALNQVEQIRDIRHYAEASSKMQSGLIITMADMVENRDSDTGAHVQKTSAYARIIAEGLKRKGYYAEKVTPEFINAVTMSAPLHDVGKISIPDGVLNKPGKLTDEEYAIMKTHTTEGRKIMEKAINTVKGENYLKEARNMAAYHHERWDGKGYPDGLHGEVIPLSARIMAVADVFDALASPRVYKPAFPLDKALSIIREGAGTQFDPKCVEVFMEALPDVKMVLKKYQEG